MYVVVPSDKFTAKNWKVVKIMMIGPPPTVTVVISREGHSV